MVQSHMTDDEARCELCGELMPPGETMFKFHGYSGPCPKEPLPKPAPINWQERAERAEAEVAALRLVVTAAQEMREECRFVSAGPLYDSVFAFDASLAAPEGFGAIDTRDGFGLAGISYAEQLAERYPVILSLLNATPSSNKNWPGNLVAEAIALFAEYEHLTSTLDRRYGQTVNDGV